MRDKEPAISDQILDLLLDALQQRQQQREAEQAGAPKADTPAKPKPAERAAAKAAAATKPESAKGVEVRPEPAQEPSAAPETGIAEADIAAEEPSEETGATAADMPAEPLESEPEISRPRIERWPSNAEPRPAPTEPLPPIQLDRMLRRLAVIMALLLILINIPFNRYGTSLARAMPDSAALIIRDGLVLKGSGEKIYVLQDDRLRWITTLEAFQYYGYSWSQVHQVEDAFLADFEEGLPIHLLLKCNNSPHIYALEDGSKRWIKDIPTFEAQGYVWNDIRFVSCNYLRALPDGPPIPEDAGPPPQPGE